MEFFDSKYFIVNKKLMSLVGVWPYTSKISKYRTRVFFFIVLTAMAVPQILGFINALHDLDLLLEHTGILLFVLLMSTKIISPVISEEKLKKLYNDTSSHFQIITDKEERDILNKYSEYGRVITIGYTIYILITGLVFAFLPLYPIVVNKFLPINESIPKEYIFPGEFKINKEQYYAQIYIYDAVTVICTMPLIVAVDSTYAALVEHCSGLFSILTLRLKKIGIKGTMGQEVAYKWIIEIIKMHQDILAFSETVQNAYSAFFMGTISVVLVYTTVLCYLIIAHLHNYSNFIRFSGLMIGVIVHLFYLTLPGQKLLDHSSALFRDTYMSLWYEQSIKSNRLLRIFLIRGEKPCTLSAAGLYVMNFANFVTVVKTSASYVTVLISFR